MSGASKRRGSTATRSLRILFVTGTQPRTGGSSRTTHQLALRLVERGHHLAALMRIRGRSVREHLYKRQVNLTTKLDGRPPAAGLLMLQRQMGRLAKAAPDDYGYPVFVSAFPENALPAVYGRFQPDVVIASSIDRIAWRRIRAFVRDRQGVSVLYMRGVSCIGHLTVSDAPPDLILSNTESVTREVTGLGFECRTIPSVVETKQCSVQSSREVVLLVNPIALLGVDVAWALARRRPDIPFVFQESWPLETRMSELRAQASAYGNVEIRSFSRDFAEVFRDARIVLAPHTIDNRPRVVLEAQSNGIPVLASRQPGLVEAVGGGGILVDPNAPIETWADALSDLWDDRRAYADHSERALAHSRRPEMDPEDLSATFEQQLLRAVQRTASSGTLSKGLQWLRA